MKSEICVGECAELNLFVDSAIRLTIKACYEYSAENILHSPAFSFYFNSFFFLPLQSILKMSCLPSWST